MVFEDDPKYGLSDAVLLKTIDEPSFIQNIKLRYTNDRIYTYIGNVIVAINPYKQIQNLYSENTMKLYFGREHYEEAPHIFSIAEQAYKQVKRFRKNTCILISGESGSGKTEASKIIMNYISAATKSVNQSEVDRIKSVLLKTNVVLEAFGNAQTTRNDNSSRFGKYMDICFDFKADCSGGVIQTYLLEKTRVINQQKDERNFHIFYQLLNGADSDILKKIGLDGQKNFNFITNGMNKKSKDASDFKLVKAALKSSGINENQQLEIFSVLSAILHLGELNFHTVEDAAGNSSSSSVVISDQKLANKIASLLRTPPFLG